MLKKFGMVSVGVTATLLAAAPLASAGNASTDADHNGNDKGHHRSHGDNDKGHNKGHHKGHSVDGDSNATCSIGGTKGGDGGHAASGQEIKNEGIAGGILGPISNGGIGGAAVGNVTTLSCDSFLNHSLNGNFSGNHASIASEQVF